LIILMIVIMSGTAIFSQDDNPDLQKSEELQNVEKILDTKLAELNKQLASYAVLKDKKITMSPNQTIVKNTNEYIEMKSYDFIASEHASNEIIGSMEKSIKLYFNGTTLSKVESEVIEENYPNKTRTITNVVDPTPSTDDNADIIIKSAVNSKEPYEVTLGSMENTLTNPTRIKFKREFYWNHLMNFERMFRYTNKYYTLYGTSTDYQTVEALKKSLSY